MRKIVALCILLLCMIANQAVYATHIYGGELLYRYISGTTYELHMTVYGDCSADPSILNTLYTATPAIAISNNAGAYSNITLNPLTGTGVEVTPTCSSLVGGTACNGGSLPGIRKFEYTNTISLNGQYSNWNFIFSGSMSANASAGRSNNITNVAGVGNSLVYLKATLNNLTGNNSSPQYTSIPTPFYCVNAQQEYNQGAVDPNNDSLTFSLTPALNGGNPVTYNAGFSATNPIATTANGFSYNMLNGQMTFTPSLAQDALVANIVYEYRNGVLVGTSMREMTFIVFNSCNNHPPTGIVSSSTVTGGITLGNNVITSCQGTANVSFTINPIDPDGDTITASAAGVPAGATVTITNNQTPAPSISVNWNTASLTPGNYTFFITYKDNGCPLSSQQTLAYTIQVVGPASMTSTVLVPTGCDHKAVVQMNVTGGLIPRTVTLKQGATTVKSYTDSTGVITDSIAAGNYTVILNSLTAPCSSTQSLVIADSGQYPHLPVIAAPVYYCKNDTAAVLLATGTVPGSIIHWYDSLGNALATPPLPSTATPGVFTWYVSQLKDVCESAREKIQVFVTQRPVASITGPAALCNTDTMNYSFNGVAGTGATQYTWNWDNAQYISGSEGGPYAVHWDTAGTKTITLSVSENLCPSIPATMNVLVKPTPKATFSYKDICLLDTLQLSYDTAAIAGTQYQWDYDGGYSTQATGIGPHMVHWSAPGTKSAFLETSLNGCIDSVRHTITVHPQASVEIINTPQTLCYGDKVYLLAHTSGGDSVTLTWLPADKILRDPVNGLIYVSVLEPGTYVAVATNEYNCISTDSVTYTAIEQCCNFSYPNAFTPNGDGTNDHFRVLTYGNDDEYMLSIFDRWGKRIFVSFSQQDSWDGTFDGKPCETGVYFYYFKAKCMTGHNEEHKGSVTLVR